MSKEEFLKIQKCVLKVNIHCDGCRQKVKKILQKIDGVFTTQIDAEQGKVTVSGNVDPNLLIKKLAKSGKHAELWGAAPKPNNNHHNNQNHLGNANQGKNMQIEQLKGMGNDNQNNKGQNPKGGGGNNQPKGGGGQQQGPNPQQQLQLQHLQQLQQQQRLQQQLQQLQQMKGFQDLNIPQFKDLKLPPHNPNPKAVKFDIPEDDEDFTDDELDDFDDDDEFDEEFDDDDDVMDELPPNKMKLPPTMMNVPKAANNVAVTANIGKKGAGPGPFQVHGGGQKGGGGGGGGHNPGGCNKSGNNGGKNGGGTLEGKNGGEGIKNNNGGGGNINNNMNMNGGKKGNPMGGVGVQPPMNAGFRNMDGGGGPHAMSGPNMGPMNMSMPNMPPVQGLPAASVNGGGYFQGGGPNGMAGNPFQQQQQLQHQQQLQQQLQHQHQLQQQQLQQQYMGGAMMGNERFQPMMYARPPPAVNYMYPPYPYPPPDPYTHFFSDENTSSCNVM